ncbi:hypothetical protein AM1_3656 [Acaryochloris marina MBIC11017]|nr:hypothetical protein AM1_3656 [Acaryochloris marina MBIC11017]
MTYIVIFYRVLFYGALLPLLHGFFLSIKPLHAKGQAGYPACP